MSGRAPYSRVYWSIVDDERFTAVYDDDRALALWLRLLLIADQAHPASAHLPMGTDGGALECLERAGLVEVKGSRYRIHGLDAERERRSRATQQVQEPEPTGDQQVPNRSVTGDLSFPRARARLVSSLNGSSKGGGVGEGWPHLDSSISGIWETATGRSVIASGNYAAEYLDDACRRHPHAEVGAAILRARKTFEHIPDPAQMVSAMRPILDPLPDPRAARDREDRAASRKSNATGRLMAAHNNGAHADESVAECPYCHERVTA